MFVPILLITAFCVNSLESKALSREKRLTCSAHTRTHQERDAVTNVELQWPGSVVYFKIDSTYTAEENALIRESFRKIEEDTCVRFQERWREKDYVFVTPSGEEQGCYADLGRIGGKQVLNLIQDGCMYEYIIVHEAIHNLGFNHEHQRPDRDDYIDVMWDNLPKGRKNTSYKKFKRREMDSQGIPYDYESVMHYDWNDAAVDPEKPTMVSKDPKYDLKPMKHDKLTPLDIQRINNIYCH